jgi:hypothetical protein
MRNRARKTTDKLRALDLLDRGCAVSKPNETKANERFRVEEQAGSQADLFGRFIRALTEETVGKEICASLGSDPLLPVHMGGSDRLFYLVISLRASSTTPTVLQRMFMSTRKEQVW